MPRRISGLPLLLLPPSTSRAACPPVHLRHPTGSSCYTGVTAQKLRCFSTRCNDRTKIASSIRASNSLQGSLRVSQASSTCNDRISSSRTWSRAFAHLANRESEKATAPKPGQQEKLETVSALAKQKKAPIDDPTPTGLKSKAGGKEQRLQDIQIVKRLLPNIWPKGDNGTKARVLVAIGLLVGGKLLNVQVPFYFKSIVDSLNFPIAELSAEQTAWTIGGAAIVGCELRTFVTYALDLRQTAYSRWARSNLLCVVQRASQCRLCQCRARSNPKSCAQRLYPSAQSGCQLPSDEKHGRPH